MAPPKITGVGEDGAALETPREAPQDENEQNVRNTVTRAKLSEDHMANKGIITGQMHCGEIEQVRDVYIAQIGRGSLYRLTSKDLFWESKTIMEKWDKKDRHKEMRLPRQLKTNDCYRPYVLVKDNRIRASLVQIAKNFQFIDRSFAAYFQVTILLMDQRGVLRRLEKAHKRVAECQNPNATSLGDLGDFFKEVSHMWSWNFKNAKFVVTHRNEDEIVHYLQDAYEVPYWEFILDLLEMWRINSGGLGADVVLRVLHSVRTDILQEQVGLLTKIRKSSDHDEEDLKPILDGIKARIAVLDGVLNTWTSNSDEKEDLLEAVRNLGCSPPAVPGEEPFRLRDEPSDAGKYTVTFIALIVLFLIGAIIPGYKAFAISMKSDETGSTEDADFWYLVQNSIMSVLGNLIMVVPLFRKSWFSAAYNMMWLFFTLGLTFAAISIGIYPFLNTGWSSMVSFFGSIASVASVLVMTQATTKEVHGAKVKID